MSTETRPVAVAPLQDDLSETHGQHHEVNPAHLDARVAQKRETLSRDPRSEGADDEELRAMHSLEAEMTARMRSMDERTDEWKQLREERNALLERIQERTGWGGVRAGVRPAPAPAAAGPEERLEAEAEERKALADAQNAPYTTMPEGGAPGTDDPDAGTDDEARRQREERRETRADVAAAAREGAKETGEEGGGLSLTAGASPVADSAAPEAIESVRAMRSREKLQAVADHDTRTTVKEAANRRLQELS